MNSEKTNRTAQIKIHWLDNLRTFAVFLVVVLHAGLVYESSGITAFFWIVDDPSTNHFSGILNIVLDIFVMSTIFFVSGYFTPGSIDRRTPREFLKSKFKRLMIPWAIGILTLIPLYKVLFLYSRGLPQEHWTNYFHWNSIWNQNWLWFLPVLFLFHVAFLLLSRLRIDLSWLSLRSVVFDRLLRRIGLLPGDGLVQPAGVDADVLSAVSERTAADLLPGLPRGRILLPAACFQSPPKSGWPYWAVAFTAGIPIDLYIVMVLYPFIRPGTSLISGNSRFHPGSLLLHCFPALSALSQHRNVSPIREPKGSPGPDSESQLLLRVRDPHGRDGSLCHRSSWNRLALAGEAISGRGPDLRVKQLFWSPASEGSTDRECAFLQ